MRSGAPVFRGTAVPVRALLEHLDRGRDVDAFLAQYPGLDPGLVRQTLALGLEALLAGVPLELRSPQRSLLPRLDASGAISNADELGVEQVVGRRVRCPGCRSLIFRSWPEGWDAHAASRCRGVGGATSGQRKAEFKRRFGHLFRG